MKEVTVAVSCPEMGTIKLDGSGPYDQQVMTMLTKLQEEGHIKIAFDRAGTSNASKEDTNAFNGATALMKLDNPIWKSMIKDTKWFQTYCGGVKKFLSALAQEHEGIVLHVICIHVSPNPKSHYDASSHRLQPRSRIRS